MPTLLPPRKRILVALYEFRREHEYGPTVRELCGMVGLSSTYSVHYHLGILRKWGWVEWDEGKTRTLRFTEKGRFRVPQTPETGLGAIVGQWPGEESDEEAEAELEGLR